MSKGKMGFWSVLAVGIGGIVGGIFPTIGLAVQLTSKGAPIAFAIAGVVVILTKVARPFMGQFGVVLVTIAALLSTTSAINATFYGSARLSYVIAESKNQPNALEKKVKNLQHVGLF